jgi:hypothetical protein
VTVNLTLPAATAAGENTHPGHVAGVGYVDPAAARRLLARAPSLRRILTDPLTGTVLTVGRESYRVPAELKHTIRLRDGHCRGPACDQPAEHTELDHTTPYAHGGHTAASNLACLCRNHHHLKHDAGWGLKQYANGTLEWTPPSGRHYTTEPEAPLATATAPRANPWAEPQPPDPDAEPAPFDAPRHDTSEDVA